MPKGEVVKSVLTVLAVAAFGWGVAIEPALAADPQPARPGAREAPRDWPYSHPAAPAVAEHGMVVSDAPLATRVGVDVLKGGGTAADAAIATAFALAVVRPSAGNIGGGGFVVASIGGKSFALDFRETAPLAARRDMFLDDKGEPTDRSITGHLAVGVPGSVAGLWALHEKVGGKPWSELLQPAIRLSEEGFEVDGDFAGVVKWFAETLRRFPASATLFLPDSNPIAAGARWRNPDLAHTLRLIAMRGRDGFYQGETAGRIVAEMRRGGGIVSDADLNAYQAKWREPVVFTYRGHRIVSMPPPSSGGLSLALLVHQLEKNDLRSLGWHTPAAIHVQAEAMRRAFAVRNEALGDPDFVEIPQARLLSREFVAGLTPISMDHATPSRLVSPIGMVAEPRHTTHFSVVDQRGNAVALTTTLNGGFGSAVTVEGAGFFLNNEMDDFAGKPGSPNQVGLVQSERNTIAPGKRMLSSMAPTIVLDRASRPMLVTGASGGPYIITTVFQLISHRLDYGLDVAASMSAPRIHHQHLPDVLYLEKGGFSAEQTVPLLRLGHQLETFAVPESGWTVAATIEHRDGRWWGVSDPRMHGLAAGH